MSNQKDLTKKIDVILDKLKTIKKIADNGSTLQNNLRPIDALGPNWSINIDSGDMLHPEHGVLKITKSGQNTYSLTHNEKIVFTDAPNLNDAGARIVPYIAHLIKTTTAEKKDDTENNAVDKLVKFLKLKGSAAPHNNNPPAWTDQARLPLSNNFKNEEEEMAYWNSIKISDSDDGRSGY